MYKGRVEHYTGFCTPPYKAICIYVDIYSSIQGTFKNEITINVSNSPSVSPSFLIGGSWTE